MGPGVASTEHAVAAATAERPKCGAWTHGLRAAALSLGIAILCFGASIPFGDFQTEATVMGKDYQLMSLDPLGGVGPHPERFLTPLCAWLVGLSGARFWLFSHGALILFFALAHHLTVRRSRDHLWATAFVFGIAISTTGATYRGLVGYSDPLSFCLLALAIACLRRGPAFWLLLALGLLNHGQNLFLWPWLVYERSRLTQLGRGDVVGAVLGLGAYGAARAWLIADGPTAGAGSFSQASLSLSWYLQSLDWPRTTDLWILILPALVYCFGAQLLVLWWDLLGPRRRERWIALALLMAAIVAILAVAVDIHRFLALLTFPMLAAMHHRFVPDRRARYVLVGSVMLTLAIRQPNLDLAQYLMDRMFEALTAGNRSPVATSVLPNHWYAFLGYAAFVGLLALVAVWSAPGRRREGERGRSARAFPVDEQGVAGAVGAQVSVPDATPPSQRQGA